MADPALPEPRAFGDCGNASEGAALPSPVRNPPSIHTGKETEPAFVLSNVDLHHQWLRDTGELVVGSGVIRSAQYCVALHTDFGPLDQDKTTNQDYALAWQANPTPTRTASGLIIAIADGVTSSFRSEWAAALTCSVAARNLAERVAEDSLTPRQKLEAAVAAASNAVRALTDELSRDPQATCPAGTYLTTWKYMLQRGRLLQTTLTLAWFDGHWLRAAVVGDGGLLWRTERPDQTGVEAQCDLNTQEVHALGPTGEQPVVLDHYVELKLAAPFLCALFTDGVGRGVGANPTGLLDDLATPESAAAENPAARFLVRAIAERSQDFSDNLTLAVLRGY